MTSHFSYAIIRMMIIGIIVVLLILWFLGYLHIPAGLPHLVLFNINGHPVTLFDLLILLLVAWAIGILPSPFRQIAGVLLLLWILAVIGIIAVSGLATILVIAIIVGLIISLF